MSISQKLTYLNETKQRQKNLINALGGNITNDTPFREYEKELVGVLPKVTGEGTNISLSPTIEYDLEVDSLKGDTTQNTLNGYNLANTNETIEPTTINGITYSLENGVFSFSGTATSATTITLTNSFPLSAGTYTIGVKDQTGSYTGTLGKYVVTKPYTVRIDGNVLSQVQTRATTENYDNCYISFYIGGNVTFTNLKFKLILVSGTYTSSTLPNWEPYCGGIPSPNPNYPQNIQVVTGTQEIKETGKNLFNGNLEIGGINNNTGENASSTTTIRTTDYIKVAPNTNYIISQNKTSVVFQYDENKNYISTYYTPSSATNTTITTSATTKYIRWKYASTDTTLQYQLEKGSTATSYSPYTSQTYTLHLGDLELAKIEDNQDYIYYDNGKWYKYGAIGKYHFIGNEGWTRRNVGSNGIITYSLNDLIDYKNLAGNISNYALCTHFTILNTVGGVAIMYQNDNYKNNICMAFFGSQGQTGNVIYLNCTIDTATNLNLFFSNNNVNLYYQLETPSTIEITNETLLSDLEYIRTHATSYLGTTNISSSGNLPVIISASAIKELS